MQAKILIRREETFVGEIICLKCSHIKIYQDQNSLTVCLFDWLSVCPSLSDCLTLCLSVYLSLYLYFRLSVFFTVRLSVYLFACLTACRSVCLSVCFIDCLTTILSVNLLICQKLFPSVTISFSASFV